MISAVVLDIDDTLCMTEAASFEIENEALAKLGRAPMSRQDHLRTWGKPLLEAIPLRSPGVDVTAFAAVYAPLLAVHAADGTIDAITEESLDAIDHLVALGLPVLLLTSRKLDEMLHLLADDHALAGRIHAAYHADNTTHLKPDPRVFDVLFDEHGFDRATTVYVGDSPTDAAAATGAGMRFVACMQSAIRTRDDFSDYPVDAYVDAFDDVADVIEAMMRPA